MDGSAKVRGAALYVDDLTVPWLWFGRTVRSRVARGRLRAIRRDAGFDWSDVVVVTAEDIPGVNAITLIDEDQPALVPLGGEVMHCDEPIALVAAASKELAAAAAAALEPDIEPLEPVLDPDRGKLLCELRIDRGGDVEAALAGCDLVIAGEYRTGAQEQMYIEPQGMLAEWEGGVCRVAGSLQCPYYVHKALVRLLGVGPDQVVVAQAVTGGGFGGKEEYPSMIAAHAALLSRAAGRPVKLIYERREDIAATTKRHPARVRHRLGLRADGTMVACDIDVQLDGGAYATLSQVVLSRAILHAAGPYQLDCVRLVGRAMATNTPPHGAFRGFGAPQTTFAYERQVQKAARALAMDPLELRRRNALRTGGVTATGQILTDSVGSDAVLDAVAAAWTRTRGAQSDAATSTRASGAAWAPVVRRGRGLSFYFHGAGFTGSGEQRLAGRATVATRASGDFEVRAGSTDIGQGALTTFTQLAAAALGIPPERVRVCETSTERVPDSGPTVASRTCMIVGRLVERAALALRDQLRRYAQGRELDPNDLCALSRAYTLANGELAETCAYQPPPGIQWDEKRYVGSAYPVYGWAACAVDVAVDMDTFEVRVERCLHAVDVGKAIHPVIVEGQIEGGTVQALGWALLEQVVYRDGAVANPSMTDCIIPTAMDVPDLETRLIEIPYEHGPHGAKGVGEIPMDGPAAAVAAAVEDALGLACDQLPITPERLAAAWAAQQDSSEIAE